ncbi:Dephospho-CoA kinase [hydrothermal vent metagenome]|uniref:Dephospho-CoA kinase n=1 Tax=hydrothermal vent metagenome TaxID=652676 RepID=A0A3B0V748_9ZZZZ
MNIPTPEHNCYTVGLTGGIASGKSAVSKIFATLGCDVIDADIIARTVVTPDSYGLAQLLQHFGSTILSKDRQLDRARLRKLVFNDTKKLALLNSILHPLIQQQIMAEIKQVKSNYCVVVIPLLCESSEYNWLDRILVVDVAAEIQLQRLQKRDSITKKLANKMLQSQCSRKQRLAIADDVINNERSLIDLQKQVERLHHLYTLISV